MNTPFNEIIAQCQLPSDMSTCNHTECVIHAYANNTIKTPMTTQQRQWLVQEANKAGEGSFPPNIGYTLTDQKLAQWTLEAWLQYVQSM